LNEAVCKGRFSVINVCDDAKVTYVFHKCRSKCDSF
jgi:hypothetical protein